jgi:hypothetical protein
LEGKRRFRRFMQWRFSFVLEVVRIAGGCWKMVKGYKWEISGKAEMRRRKASRVVAEMGFCRLVVAGGKGVVRCGGLIGRWEK